MAAKKSRSPDTSKRVAAIGGAELPSLRGVPKHLWIWTRHNGKKILVCTVGEYLSLAGSTVRQAKGKARA